jgi:hypothetical protein
VAPETAAVGEARPVAGALGVILAGVEAGGAVVSDALGKSGTGVGRETQAVLLTSKITNPAKSQNLIRFISFSSMRIIYPGPNGILLSLYSAPARNAKGVQQKEPVRE